MCSSATKRFGHLHFHLVHFKELNKVTAKIFVIFNLFYYYDQEISMSYRMCPLNFSNWLNVYEHDAKGEHTNIGY